MIMCNHLDFEELDFVSQPSIEHCKFCIYGKSLMNLYLYKDCSATVRSYLAVLSQYISILIMMWVAYYKLKDTAF